MKKYKNKLSFQSKLYLSWKNFMDRKWRNLLISLATSIGFTGILISFGLGNAIISMIDHDAADSLPSQVQVSLNNKFAIGSSIEQSDENYIRKAVGQDNIKYLEKPFSLTMTGITLVNSGKHLDLSQTFPNYAQIVSLYTNSKISVDANTSKEILAGQPYKNQKEEGITLPKTFLEQFNKINGTDYKPKDILGKEIEITVIGQGAEGSKTAAFRTKIIRILKDELSESNSFMAPVQMDKILKDYHLTKIVPYIIFELKEAEETKKVTNTIKKNNRYLVLSQEAILETVVTFIKVIQGLLIVLSTQAIIVSIVMIGVIIYINIMERSREIGVMKAVGYLTKDVRSIFVTEALLITFLALLIALLFSGLVGAVANQAVKAYYPSISKVFELDISSVLTATGLAFFMGLISSYFPTLKVGKLDPVEALRYE